MTDDFVPHRDDRTAHRRAQAELLAKGCYRCTKCDWVKSVGDFLQVKTRGGRPRQPCKSCYSEQQKERYRNCGGVDRVYTDLLKRAYGLTLDQYQERVAEQGGVCAICELPPVKRRSKTRVRLQVDHDHKTGAVRELLCSRCNRLVWALEDHHGLMGAVLRYLAKHGQDGISLTLDIGFYQAPETVAPHDFRPFEPGPIDGHRAKAEDSVTDRKVEDLRSPALLVGSDA